VPGDVAIIGPRWGSDAVELSSTLFRKRVLPVGEIDYKGRKIKFDTEYFRDLVASFNSGAFDQVAFQLAKDDNSHTLDPERYRGEVKGMEVMPEGLDVILELTDDAAELVRKNPKLGVSARIIEGLEHAVDGKKFNRAIHHVLGTLDPRVTGLGPWQEVSLSDEVKETIDLTDQEVLTLSDTAPNPTASPPTQAPPVASTTTTAPPAPQPTGRANEPLPVLTEDDIRVGLNSLSDEDVEVEDQEDDEFDLDSLTDEELAELAAEFSETQRGAQTIDYQDVADPRLDRRVQALELELSRQKWVNEMRLYIEQGVPPVMLELARPILSLPRTPVIDLANERGGVDHIDVGQVVRSLLEQAKGFLDLTVERGHSWEPDGEAEENALYEAWTGGKS